MLTRGFKSDISSLNKLITHLQNDIENTENEDDKNLKRETLIDVIRSQFIIYGEDNIDF